MFRQYIETEDPSDLLPEYVITENKLEELKKVTIKKELKGSDKSKLLKLEQDFVIQYLPRMETIGKIVSKVQKNQVIDFYQLFWC